jgi:hypothetical protein
MNERKEIIEKFIRTPFANLLIGLGLEKNKLITNILVKDGKENGVTFFLGNKKNALFSIDHLLTIKEYPDKRNIVGWFFFNGMESLDKLNSLIAELPPELLNNIQKPGLHNGSLPKFKCNLYTMEQLFECEPILNYFQAKFNKPFDQRKIQLILHPELEKEDELIETEILFNDPNFQELIDHIQPDSWRNIEKLEAKMKDMTPKARQRTSMYIERGKIAKDVKKLTGFKCQICEALGLPPHGFKKEKSNEPYVESHHVISVSTLVEGLLSIKNIMTLCANHHRQMHYGNVSPIEYDGEYFVFKIDDTPIKIKKISIND